MFQETPIVEGEEMNRQGGRQNHVMRRVIHDEKVGQRFLQQLECGHTMDSVSPAMNGFVPCFECSIELECIDRAQVAGLVYLKRGNRHLLMRDSKVLFETCNAIKLLGVIAGVTLSQETI